MLPEAGVSVESLDALPLSLAFTMYARDVIAFRNQSRKTQEHHFVTLKSLTAFLGKDILVGDLSFDVVREWKLSLEKRKLSSETVRGYLVRLRVVLGYLRLKGVDCLDPASIPLPRRSHSVPGVLTPEEVARLIKATGKIKNKALISLLYSTGLRVAELCALDRKDVKQDFMTIIGKGGKSRLCFIDERTRGLLDEYLLSRTDAQPALFISPFTGLRITPGTVQDIFRNARVKAGFDWPVHPHTMRHSFATNLMIKGAPVYGIMKLMGHASLDTTALYLKLYDPQLSEIHKKYHTTK